MRLLIRCLILLCPFILVGHVYRHNRLIAHSRAALSGSQITNPSPSTRRKIDRIKAEEIEDDEESDNKHLFAGNYHYDFFYSYTNHPLANPSFRRLPFCPHFSLSSSDRLIRFRVIRV